MDLSSLTRFRLRRVNPYRGLVIDETTWTEAHDYHRDHVRLHTLAFHNPGVIAGLEVKPTPSQAGSVDVAPGIALDPEGNMLVVSQDRHVPFDGVEAGDVYVVISYLENRVNSDPSAPRGSPANRIVESYKIDAVNKLADTPYLELARVHWTGAEAAVKNAADADNPQPDEIDLRFRATARAARPFTVNVGLVAGEGTGPHVHGVSNLLREVNGVAGFEARFRGRIDLEDGVGGSDLIYLCAPVAGEAAVTSLSSHLGRGGAVLADACASEANGEFSKGVQELAGRLGLRLKPLEAGDPLLDTRYTFGEPPAGAVEGKVLGQGRFVLSERDYGCAWAGFGGKATLSRETVRSALEWGVNLAIASVQPPSRSG
jgi:Domain of unknown function (DUF4159)